MKIPNKGEFKYFMSLYKKYTPKAYADNAKDLHVVMPVYNLTEYSDNHAEL